MAPTIQNNFRARKNFGKIQKVADIPNLIAIQKSSYDKFLQADVPPEKRDDTGLQGVFKSVFPISDFRENSSLEFIEYSIGNWECKCGKLVGLQHLRKPCVNCGATLVADGQFGTLTENAVKAFQTSRSLPSTGIVDQAVLDHFGETRPQFTRWQGAQRAEVRQHCTRLVKRADQVLAAGVIDARLAAHGGVDHGQRRGGDADVGDPTQPGRGHEPREVRRRSSADADHLQIGIS